MLWLAAREERSSAPLDVFEGDTLSQEAVVTDTFGNHDNRRKQPPGPKVAFGARLPKCEGQELPQESLRAHPRGTPAGPRAHLGAEIGSLTERIKDYDLKLEAISKEHYPETDLC
jgi:hypothetical protein